ncbi:YwiC-like family protein [Tessaracoccus oleiagri]|uniref:YwiC-like protein n=1 Tax=Tessaracoccus oleiagri TaxID=686624 RepID=A0A1G9LMZ5_9ACTN|nr:YwiC-like family protein [Tessaracoccus oleiagri]SDL63211.1 YwiC-like protein [Tessaracoccus oleiagri]
MRSKGWIPKQHGAWAMLVVPFLLGLVGAARASALGWGHLTLFVFWMLGYFTFNAASGWLKAAPRQRPKYVRPLLVYACASALAGLATLLLVGLRPLPWAFAFLPLMVPALWLASRRRERATIGGLLTIAAASLMVPVARYLHPSAVDDRPEVTAAAVLVFAYFFGTVLFVKTNLRERGSRTYLVASIGYHVGAALLAAALAAAGVAGWWWVAVLGAALLRAVVVPPLRWKPLPLGMIEIALSAAIVLGALLS